MNNLVYYLLNVKYRGHLLKIVKPPQQDIEKCFADVKMCAERISDFAFDMRSWNGYIKAGVDSVSSFPIHTKIQTKWR